MWLSADGNMCRLMHIRWQRAAPHFSCLHFFPIRFCVYVLRQYGPEISHSVLICEKNARESIAFEILAFLYSFRLWTLKFLFDAVRLCFSSFVLLLLALAAAQSLAYIKLEIRRGTHPSRQGKRKRKKKERTTISLLVFHKTQSSFSFWTFSLSLFLSFDCVMFEPSWTPK